MVIATLHPDKDTYLFGTKLLSCKIYRAAFVSEWIELKRHNSVRQKAVGIVWAMRPLCIGKGRRLRHAVRSWRTWAPCTCFGRFRNDSQKMQGCQAEFTAHVRFEIIAILDSSDAATDVRPWTCQCRTALSNAERAGVVSFAASLG